MDTTMYDKLLKLPLFQGLSKYDLTVILEKVKIEFRNYKPDELLVRQDEPCTELIYLMDGTIKTCTVDNEAHFTLIEMIQGDFLIEPYSLYGIRPFYNATYRAETEVNVLVVKKKDIIPILCKYDIFNLNFFNLISNRAQTMQQRLWNTHIGNSLERIVNFMSMRCATPAGTKILYVTMEDLADMLDDTRINVSRVLNMLQDKGLISLSRKVIKMNDLKELVLLTKNQQVLPDESDKK